MGYDEALADYVSAAGDEATVRSLLRPLAAGETRSQTARTGLLRRRTPVAPPVTGSYVGGHPFLLEGAAWPLDEGGSQMHFVVQVSFADVPPLPDFPSHGLLQLFVRDDDLHGLTLDASAGRVGFACRWFTADELAGAVSVRSDDRAFTSRYSPLEAPSTPLALDFRADQMLPWGFEHLATDVADHTAALAALDDLRHAEADLHEALDEAAEHGDVRVGGWPKFLQGAPDPPPGCSSRLLLGLEGPVFRWGDLGHAHLFGDPVRLARGDLSDLWWEWSC